MTVANKFLGLLVVLSVGALAQCRPTITPVGGTDCKSACENLARLECPEAVEEGDGCVGTCDHILASGLVAFNAQCVANAASIDAVRLCPNVSCPK